MSSRVRLKRPAIRGKLNLVRRVLWYCVWLFLFRPTPRPLHAWRRALLRIFGAKIGAACHPYPRAWVWAPWNLVMAERSCLSDGVDCYNVDAVTLGVGAIVSQRAFLCTASHDINDPQFPLVTAPIRIGDGAWVAAEAFVGPGVTIGAGAVVGARASVTKDVEPGAVVVGNPARVVKRRQIRNPSVPSS